MKRFLIKHIFLMLFAMLCFLPSVHALPCEYVPIASVNERGIYTSPTPSYELDPEDNWMTERGYYIKLDSYNSGTSHRDLGGKEKVLDWKEEKCPNIIRVTHSSWWEIFDGVKWYGYDDLDTAKEAIKKKDGTYKAYDKFMILDSYLKELQDEAEANGETFDKTKSYECTYNYFSINYNKDGYALSADALKNSLSIQYFYSLSDKIKTTPVTNPGTCQTVHYCLTNRVGSVYSYTIFYDEKDYNSDKGSWCSESIITEDGHYDASVDPDPGQKPNNGSDQEVERCEVLPKAIENYIKQALKLIRWGGLVLMIVLGTLDFVKASASDDQDAIKKAGQNFIKRLIAVIILFLLPILVELILFIAGKIGFNFGECYKVSEF